MMKRGGMFDRVQTLKPGRSVFDLSYAKKMSGKMGYLYPMMADEVVPGDVFDIGMEAVVRFAPMVAPVLHEIVLKADWFFVPYRILDQRNVVGTDGKTLWEEFITGGNSGTFATPLVRAGITGFGEGSLPDHLGIPPGLTLVGDDNPLAYLFSAYTCIYNEYYRDPNLEAELLFSNSSLLTANWDPDYFTRALPWQQRGTAPAIPIQGNTSAVFPGSMMWIGTPTLAGGPYVEAGIANNVIEVTTGTASNNWLNALNSNTVSLSPGVGVSISDLRLAVQLQRWMERNARSGYRYTEFLRAHFGVAPRDDRLDRPEYIGGVRQPIVISEVLQTSQTGTTPQGNQAGHGILAGRHNVGRYHVKEYGLIMAIMSVIPRAAYQQGINKQWLRVSKYDFYHPEFANLSEQAIKNEEIYADNSVAGTNQGIFGYQGRYDEMRSKNDMVAGAFRSTLNYWHLGRIFSSLPALNSTFGHVDPTTITRIFAVPSADHLYVHWGNRIKAIRPLPMVSNPGRLDHDYGGY